MDREQKERREKTILAIMDELSLDLEKTIAEIQKTNPPDAVIPKFRAEAKSKVHYWLSMLYDEMEAREKNLEIAYDGAREIIKKLRDSSPVMQRPVFQDDNLKVKEIVGKKIGDR